MDKALIPRKHYDSCSKSDAKLSTYIKSVMSPTFWNSSSVYSINGIPGITNGLFTGILWQACFIIDERNIMHLISGIHECFVHN